jgi:hypothetical protein
METYFLEVPRVYIHYTRIRGCSWVRMLYANLVTFSDVTIADSLVTRIRVTTRL